MTTKELTRLYLEWMMHQVCDDEYKKPSYRQLLSYLNEVEFTYLIPMDGNRAEDGVDLRYVFGRDCRIEDAIIASYLDDHPCSVLEMMIALAMRCEINIMDNPDVGNRTGQWFWNMIVNLGLGGMTDDRFDEDYVDDVLYIFLNREYSPNGEGGLFTVQHARRDMRTVDIWYQLNWYLSEILD